MTIISTPDDLRDARKAQGLSTLTLDLTRFLNGNLPLYAIRQCLWALDQGGRLDIQAPTSVDSVNIAPGRWAFQFVTQLVAKANNGLGRIVEWDRSRRRIVCERTTSPLPPGPWSAAVVYSGQAAERDQLLRCVEALFAQPEIREGGQVLVCGPEDSADDVRSATGSDYLAFPHPVEAGRLLIGAKKMAAIRQLRHARLLICHTRILLRPGALAAMPNEFDLITPQVSVDGVGGTLPYLDLGFIDRRSVALHSSREQVPVFYDRRHWMSHLKTHYPYVDGGLFCVRRSLVDHVPMDEAVAWGEGEDVEWATRLLFDGKLVELAEDAHAHSMTCKAQRYARFGHHPFYPAISAIVRSARMVKARIGLSGRAS